MSVMQPNHGTEAYNRIVWRDEEVNLPVLPYVPEGRENFKVDATTSTWPWSHGMVHIKVHPPHHYHPQEIHKSPKGTQA